MEFKIDENLPSEARQLLRAAGHDAVTVLDQDLSGHQDAEIAAVCRSESRILITLDTDFANILAYPLRTSPGVIVIRTDDQSKPSVLHLLRRLIACLESESPRQRLWIVEPNRIRVREAE